MKEESVLILHGQAEIIR